MELDYEVLKACVLALSNIQSLDTMRVALAQYPSHRDEDLRYWKQVSDMAREVQKSVDAVVTLKSLY